MEKPFKIYAMIPAKVYQKHKQVCSLGGVVCAGANARIAQLNSLIFTDALENLTTEKLGEYIKQLEAVK